jgi:DNA-binding response OmpR family regulator
MPHSSIPPPRRTSSGIRPRGPLVLLVAEEDSLRERYAAELAASGFMVLEATDGAAAIEKALQFGPHAVVLELEFKAVDGLRVARRLRTDDRTQDVSIIALTSSSWKFGTMALGAGCDSVLRKPVLAAALIGELVRLIARRSKERVDRVPTLPDAQEVAGKGKT